MVVKFNQRIFGCRIKRLREERGFTREELAGFLGITSSQMGRYERGICFMSFVRLFRLSEFLNAPVGYFFGSDLSLKVSSLLRRSTLSQDELERFLCSFAAIPSPERRAYVMQIIDRMTVFS